jgi:NAD+-dependent farnesol dehydrogenase
MGDTTLVTGATGYLGAHLIERLLARGEGPVRVLVRAKSRAAFEAGPHGSRVELVEGDLAEPASLPAAVEGAARVFHAAAFVTRWTRTPLMFDRINVEGTRALLDAAAAAGVRDFVYTSSFIALGPSGGRVADESNEHPGNFRNAYERTKKQALDVAAGYTGRGLGLKIVFPGVVFGPGALTEGNLVAGIVRDFLRRRFPLLGDGRGRWCYSFVEDVAEGHLLASERGVDGGRYFLGGENLTMPELLAMLERLSGVRRLRLRVPFWAGSAMGWLNERLAPLGVPVQLTSGEVAIFREDWAFSSERARRELGYRITPAEEALSKTVAWVREQAP